MRRFARQLIDSALTPVGLELRRIKPSRIIESTDAWDLDSSVLVNCRVLPSREHWLETLPPGSTGAEVGVSKGDYTDAILRLAKPKKLVLIDLWDSDRFAPGYCEVMQRFASQIAAGRVEVMRGSSTEILPRLGEASLDWVYIDTTHAYELTRDELALCEPLIRREGRIAGHDYCGGSVISGAPYGVIRAVHEFCIERRWIFDSVSLASDGHFSFCLQRASE